MMSAEHGHAFVKFNNQPTVEISRSPDRPILSSPELGYIPQLSAPVIASIPSAIMLEVRDVHPNFISVPRRYIMSPPIHRLLRTKYPPVCKPSWRRHTRLGYVLRHSFTWRSSLPRNAEGVR
jgi:hypothetical protein